MLFLSEKDLLLTPIYLLVIYIIILLIRKNVIKDPLLKKYFLRGITLKLIGALLLGIIYEFFYRGGDTKTYFDTSKIISNIFWENPFEGIKYIISPELTSAYHNKLNPIYSTMHDSGTFLIARIAGFLGLFCFSTYSIIALFIGSITFYGIWSLFCLLYEKYPTYHKQIAIAFLYMPSVFFWGSGLMKDGICLSSLCLAFYSLNRLFITKKKKYIISLLFSLYIVVYIKIYIALCFVPAALMWFFIKYNNKIRSVYVRVVLMPLCMVIGIGLGIYFAKTMAENDKRYNFETIAFTAQETANYIGRISMLQGGSYYTLGEYEATPLGILSVAPKAIWVTLFRPYLWESKNLAMALSALESFFFLWITIRVFFVKKTAYIFKSIVSNEYIFFSIIFSLTFALAVGVSTYNFGTLVRYKIPLMPFYLSSLYLILMSNEGFRSKRLEKKSRLKQAR